METPDQENARLLAPYIEARNAAAHAVLEALLNGHHAESQTLLQEYQMCVVAVEGAEQICKWFDDGTAGDHIVIE